jgi:16S rRNA processing protein RimM
VAEDPGENRWMVIARIIGPRGNRGEVAAIPLTDNLQRFKEPLQVRLSDAAGSGSDHREATVETAWTHKGRLVLKFRGVDTISEADELRGCEVCVPLASRPELPPGEYYQSDLVGCDVIEQPGGRRIGRVADLVEGPGQALLRVEGVDGAEILIPFARSICVEIDPQRKRILVNLPGGLEELNR